MRSISTSAAPAAIGPYSQAVEHRGLLFVSGQLPVDPATAGFPSEDAAEQAMQCLKNIQAIAIAAGVQLDNTLKTTVLLTSMADFSVVNEVYARFFSEPYPARATYAVAALPKGAKVEIEAVIGVE